MAALPGGRGGGRGWRRSVLLGFLVLSLASCRGLGGPGLPTALERQSYTDALAELARDRDSGVAQLRSFVLTWPRSPLADDAALRLAELALEDENLPEATQRLRWVTKHHAEGDRADRSRILLAGLQRKTGQLEAAWVTANEIRIALLSRDERREVHRLLADLARDRGDVAGELRWLARTLASARNENEAALANVEIDEVLSRASAQELERAGKTLGRRAPAGRVQLRITELLLEAGRRDEARAALTRAGELPLSTHDAARLARLEALLGDAGASGPMAFEFPEWRGGVPDASGASGTLGVALPLSGRLRGLGESCLEGILLAAGVFEPRGDVPPGREVRLEVRDTRGDPDLAAAAVRSLAADVSVAAIIGPLLSGETQGAVGAAVGSDVPLVSLARREEFAPAGENVFRLGTTSRSEVTLLASYAVNELGASRFAILYPKDAYGQSLRVVFWDAVESLGGEVVGVAGYDPEATDFAEPIRSLVGYRFLTWAENEVIKERDKLLKRAKRLPYEQAMELRQEAAELTLPGDRPLPPVVDFDALFIPESHDKVALIAPQLAFHDVRRVRLLGASGWHHPDLVSIGRQHVEGAVFTAAFHVSDPQPAVEAFTRRYRAAFQRDPERLAAEAYDAANLVLLELKNGARSREGVRRGLLRVSGHPGASGALSMGPDGNARKRPFLLGVHRGEIVPADELPVPEEPPADEAELPDDGAGG